MVATGVFKSSGRRAAAPSVGLACALAVAACAADVPRATLLDSERSGVALADLQRGRTLYLSKCTACHSAVGPRTMGATAWPEHVAEMAERAGLTRPEHALIVTYLTAFASDRPARP